MTNRAAAAAVACLLLLAAGCGMKPEKHYQAMRPKLLARDFGAATEYIEKAKGKVYGKKERLLYYMDKGTVLHLAKKYEESNAVLEDAKATAEELWTESVGSNIAAWMTTDNSLPYQGEDFEKVLIHFVAALNYIALGETSGARVEARQITNELELYNSKYEEHKNAYADDAFARWLAGKLAETEGGRMALNDAWIDYRKAIQVYQADYGKRYHTQLPRFVVQDALRVLEALGSEFEPEYNELRSRFPSVAFKTQAEAQGLGQVLLIHSAGEAPYKKDKFWNVYDRDAVVIEARREHGRTNVTVHGRGKLLMRIAYPEFVPKKARVTSARISVGGASADTELAENVTAIAIQNLNDHMGRIKAKAIARAVTKFVAQEVAKSAGKSLSKKKGKAGAAGAALQIAGALWQVGSAIAEKADKRSWITLPSSIGVARVWAAPGEQNMQVRFNDGQTIDIPVNVEPGKITIVSYRTFR
jgi:hypothetical protein